MSRIRLAFVAFFSLLFKGRLPGEAAQFLPEGTPAPAALPGATATEAGPPPALPPVAARPARAESNAEQRVEGALVLLGLLQREGRLVDFLRESLEGYDDAAIGAAVRDIHRGCRKVLDDHVRIEAVMPGEEDSPVNVPRGFDPGEVRLIGEARGEPPFRGTLVHHGWRATEVRFPVLAEGVDRRVLAPAEVRVGPVAS